MVIHDPNVLEHLSHIPDVTPRLKKSSSDVDSSDLAD
jgi:hypothetical protein